MKILSVLVVILFLSGCSTISEYILGSSSEQLQTSEMDVCRNASIQDIQDKYCTDKKSCQRWADFCLDGNLKNVWKTK